MVQVGTWLSGVKRSEVEWSNNEWYRVELREVK